MKRKLLEMENEQWQKDYIKALKRLGFPKDKLYEPIKKDLRGWRRMLYSSHSDTFEIVLLMCIINIPLLGVITTVLLSLISKQIAIISAITLTVLWLLSCAIAMGWGSFLDS